MSDQKRMPDAGCRKAGQSRKPKAEILNNSEARKPMAEDSRLRMGIQPARQPAAASRARAESGSGLFQLLTTPGCFSANPNGIPAQSPGLRVGELPWEGVQNGFNPNGVASIRSTVRTKPRWGWHPLSGLTQGSSFLATLGWATESLWDSRSFRARLVGNGKIGLPHSKTLPRPLRPSCHASGPQNSLPQPGQIALAIKLFGIRHPASGIQPSLPPL